MQKLNVTDRQMDGRTDRQTDGRTDGGHCYISRPGPPAPREIIRIYFVVMHRTNYIGIQMVLPM